ncbi:MULTISPECIES: hypothetical protein [unclassified Streptomyces]|uniref:hypothetical protein n=1 Tax=unclassified Streptomyces TaxID=2593676 RepID=UPI003826F564
MTTSLTPPTHQVPAQGDGRKKSRKKQWTAAVALLAGAGLLSAGGYAAVQSDLLVKSGVFSVDAAPMADAMDLKVDNAEEFAKKVTFKDMTKGSTVSHDFTLRNKGNREDIKQVALKSATAKSNGQPVSDALGMALNVKITKKGSHTTLYKGDLYGLMHGGKGRVLDVDLPKGGKKAAEFTITVSFADNLGDAELAEASGKSLDSIDFTFRGTGK